MIKLCRCCGRSYSTASSPRPSQHLAIVPLRWDDLPLLGLQECIHSWRELRNCRCGSTLSGPPVTQRCTCEVCATWGAPEDPTLCDRYQAHPVEWHEELTDLVRVWLSSNRGVIAIDPCDLVHDFKIAGVDDDDLEVIAEALIDELREDEEAPPRVLWKGALRCVRCTSAVEEHDEACTTCGRDLARDLVRELVASVIAVGGALNDARRVA